MTNTAAPFHGQNSRQDSARPPPGDLQTGFVLDGWTVQPALTRVTRDGIDTRLEPRVMDVLVYLARHQGQLVSREELEASVWAGSIVSYDALTGAIQKLRKAFNDDPRRPRVIETLSKKGYRLVAPVVPLDGTAAATPVPARPATPPATRRHLRWPVAGAGLVILLLALAGIRLLDKPATSPPVMPSEPNSIAVLPFDNLSRDPAKDYFSDGMTDELITGLAKHPDLLVIARDSSFMYRDSVADPGTIAGQLNVRYLLQGSVRRDGNQVRINAQLLDSRKGSLVWAESYDGTLDDIFALQDRITGQIVTSLTARITGSGTNTARSTGNIEAYDNFLLGRKHFYLYHNREENRKAREFFTTSIRFDERFAMAWAMLAWTHVFDAMNGWSDDRVKSLQLALEQATHALDLEQALPVAYWVRGLSYREMGEYVKAMVEAEKAIEYDPNYANAHVLLATLLYFAGRPEEGLEKMLKAMQIHPHHPFNYTFHLGQAYFILHRYDEAIAALRKASDSNPASERVHVWLAASLARNRNPDDAQWEATQVRTLNPEFSMQRMSESLPFKNPNDREYFLDSLRMAGFS